jgi:lipid A ethanolaminephosphotransferase
MKKININFSLTKNRFIILYTSLLYLIHNILLKDKIIIWFTTKGDIDYVGLFAFYIAGLFLFIAFFIILAHKYIIKIFSLFLIISSAASTYFILKYNVAIDRSMILNTIHTEPTESLSLITYAMIPYVIFLIFIPIILILKTKIIYDTSLKHLLKTTLFFVLTLCISLIFIYAKFNSMHVAGNKSEKYLIYQFVPLNIIIGLGSSIKHYIQDNYKLKSKKFKIDGNITSNDDLIVILAVGETSRQKNFSLYGYSRNTNPQLSKINNLYNLNGIAKYGSTIWAIPNILSRDDIKLASIASYLGIDTACYSNFTNYGNCGIVPEIMVSNCGHNAECYDEDVIPLLQENLQKYKKGKKLIILHLGGGSHGPIYSTRYPKEFQKFKPMCKDADIMNNCTKKEVYNSYDNTILYVDNVVSNIIKNLDVAKVPYVFIYLSDHGESLLENGRIFHGMPPGISLPAEQAQIPLIIKASMPIKIVKKDEYKQQYVYDTILDLLSIDTKILKRENIFIKK